MKKHFAFGIALLSVTAVFAQSRDEGRNNRYGDYSQSRDIAAGRDATHGNVYSYSTPRNNNRYDDQRRLEDMDRVNEDYDRRGYEDQRRWQEMDRVNTGYDRRRYDNGNGRSVVAYEHDRRSEQGGYERNENLKSFAGGAVVGAVAGVLLGVVLSH